MPFRKGRLCSGSQDGPIPWQDDSAHRRLFRHRPGRRLRFAGYGARVVLAARSEPVLEEIAAAIRAKGGEACAIATDVTDPDQCQQAVAIAAETFGGIDILISSAGLSLRGYFEGTRLEVLERVMRVNFFGTLY